MKVAIIGSGKFKETKDALTQKLLENGIGVNDICKVYENALSLNHAESGADALAITTLSKSDYVYVVCDGGYVGHWTALAIGYAFAARLEIISSYVLDKDFFYFVQDVMDVDEFVDYLVTKKR